MLLLLLAYLGGIITILSPCILPVLPFVFARADQPFRKSGLPLLAGMAITFAAVASIAAIGGGWAVRANQYGRVAALVLITIFGITLLSASLADRLTRPIVRLGNRLSQSSGEAPGVLSSLLLGVATGLLWAPCAGPILGLVLTGAALQGASAHTFLLLVAYSAGAATSLAVALLAGGRAFAAMKRSLGAEAWIRRILGVAILAGVAAVALGLDRTVLIRLSLAQTNGVEQTLLNHLLPGAHLSSEANSTALAPEGDMPELSGANAWLNSQPLNRAGLRGKVVLIDFWTYSCINCLRTLPYTNAWAQKYKDAGLVVIGVHTPEFSFEKDQSNVAKAVHDLGISYPVAIDNDYAIWRAFKNQYWPAHYFIDINGKIRYHHFGEGKYDQSEKVIQTLLAERNGSQTPIPQTLVSVQASGALAAPDDRDVQSNETYLGYGRAENFAAPGGLQADDETRNFTPPANLQKNQWAFAGRWTDFNHQANLDRAPGSILYRFHARDLHLVLGPGLDGKPVRFRVKIDGHAPGADHGADTNAAGLGTITGQRLYQLIRQQAAPGTIQDHTFEIEFLDPGVQAFVFTFG